MDPPSFSSHTFTHPTLGPLTGRLLDSIPGVVHFRSIPFARIPARFRQSVMITSFAEGESRDFTEYGTACPAPAQVDQIEAVGGLLPGEVERKFDEFSCLNLTISAPKDSLGSDGRLKDLPVMVYVHGGAFKVGGGHVSDLHDTTRLVEMSIKEGHPVIIVSIHYRLNWFGFLACQDVLDEAASIGESPSNFGLYDQRTAFLWVHRFIPGFGGSASKVTAFGESAGSGSIALHMCSSVPLFNRAILMSGTTATGPPLELKYMEAEYFALLAYCGINEKDPERLKKLREVPAVKLVEAIDGVGVGLFHSLRDGAFFPRGFPSWWTEGDILGSCDWVSELMVGDAFLEGWILADRLKHVSLSKFIQLSNATLGPSNVSKLLSAYGITPDIDANAFWTQLMYLMGDIIFSEPSNNLLRYLATQTGPHKKKVYRYTMTMRNPFPGSQLHQIPGHHFIDLLFLFQTLQHRYPTQRLHDLSAEFGRRWLRFGAGLEPWDEFKIGETEEKIMVITGLPSGFDLRSRKQDEEVSKMSEEGERRYAGWAAIAAAMNDLAGGEGGLLGAEAKRLAWMTGKVPVGGI